MSSGSMQPDRLQPYDRRIPTKFERIFSYGVVSIVVCLGILILLNIFRINPSYKIPLGLILVGYGLIRFWMFRSRYHNLESREENVNNLTKEDGKNLRN
jgi:ABC-type iron transport system FetAB permease component